MNIRNGWRTAVTDTTGNTSRRFPRALRSYLLAFGALLLLTTACNNPAQTQDPTLNEELTALQAQVGDFESQVTEQTQALQDARARVNELEARLAEQQQQVAEAETVVQERDQFRQQLAARQTALQRAQARIRNLEQRRELTLEERLASINQRIDILQQERAQLNGQAGGQAGPGTQAPATNEVGADSTP